MKRALFGLAVLALVLAVPAQHDEVEAGRGGAVEIEFCESTIEEASNSGGSSDESYCTCSVTRCYSMTTNLLVSMEVDWCHCVN